MAEEGPQDWSERASSREQKRAEQAAQDARAQLLEAKEQEEKNSDFVAAAFGAVIAANEERVRELQDRLDELDRLSLKALTQAQDELEEIHRNANQARDGRHVYRAADGNVYDEDGKLVGHDEIDWTTWDDDGSTHHHFTAALRLLRERTEFRRDVLETQERLEDGDLTEEELENLEEELDDLENRAPESNANAFSNAAQGLGRDQAGPGTAYKRTTSAAKAIDGASGSEPSLREPFFTAATGNDAPSEQHAADIAPDPSTHTRLDDFATPHKPG